MYNHLVGNITEKTPTYVVVECNGIGFLVNISLNTYTKIGELKSAKLFTHLAIREDAHTLYGFADEQEREMFRMLISVSGVGSSTARMILSSLSPEEISTAIATGNVALLKGVKGIGEKSAQRIIVDLKGKVGISSKDMGANIFITNNNTFKTEALSALNMLGFAKNIAEKGIEKALKVNPSINSVEDLIKQALKNI
ncbi:MAG: Holliday junction branch migration protein RuvA [Bacteroidetes bacterium]|nr:Holliday junction branch migration protein RuvA [Bacteroidota bacterium]